MDRSSLVDTLDLLALYPGLLELHLDRVAELPALPRRSVLVHQHAARGERVEVGRGFQLDVDRVFDVPVDPEEHLPGRHRRRTRPVGTARPSRPAASARASRRSRA